MCSILASKLGASTTYMTTITSFDPKMKMEEYHHRLYV